MGKAAKEGRGGKGGGAVVEGGVGVVARREAEAGGRGETKTGGSRLGGVAAAAKDGVGRGGGEAREQKNGITAKHRKNVESMPGHSRELQAYVKRHFDSHSLLLNCEGFTGNCPFDLFLACFDNSSHVVTQTRDTKYLQCHMLDYLFGV